MQYLGRLSNLGDCGHQSLVHHAQGHGLCDDYSRSVTLPRFIASTSDIAKESKILLKMLGIPAPELRGVGLAVSLSSSHLVKICHLSISKSG